MRKLAFFCFIYFFAISLYAKNVVEDYQPIFLPVYSTNGDLSIAIRSFKMNGEPSFLTVNPDTLQTQVVAVTAIMPHGVMHKKAGYFTHWNIASTRYYQLLNKNTAAPYVLENQGLSHADNLTDGQVLTVDLCPSSKPFESGFFNELVSIADASQKPIPVTLAISGMWLIQHQDEFQWLLAQEKANKLNITWANHSFSHPFYIDLPYSQNFLLSEGTNVNMEIVATEKYLLEAGEMPSVFFRFPGLVSDEHWIKKLKKYGLIPLGADAWLAKNQPIRAGSIILVHGNGNEPAGIALLMPQLRQLKLQDIKNAI